VPRQLGVQNRFLPATRAGVLRMNGRGRRWSETVGLQRQSTPHQTSRRALPRCVVPFQGLRQSPSVKTLAASQAEWKRKVRVIRNLSAWRHRALSIGAIVVPAPLNFMSVPRLQLLTEKFKEAGHEYCGVAPYSTNVTVASSIA